MYVDGFVVPVPKDRIEDYKTMAAKVLDIFVEHGAIGAVEAEADDVPPGKVTDFARSVALEEGEVPFFSFILYPDRATRDRANAAVMADPRLDGMKEMPFDAKRMIYGGFRGVVERGFPA